jgi:hypothetical protein
MKMPVRWRESCCAVRNKTRFVLILSNSILLCYVIHASFICVSEQTSPLRIRNSGPRCLHCFRHSERKTSSRILFMNGIQSRNLVGQVLRCRGGFETEALLVVGPLISACHEARDRSQTFMKRQLVSESYRSMASQQSFAEAKLPSFPSYNLRDQSAHSDKGCSNLSNMHMIPKQDANVWSYLFRDDETFLKNTSGIPLNPEPLDEKTTSLFGRSKSGELIPIEIVELNNDNKSLCMDTSDSPISLNLPSNQSTEQYQKQEVLSELQSLAKEFPSCAKYLMGELDKRRSYTSIPNILCVEPLNF